MRDNPRGCSSWAARSGQQSINREDFVVGPVQETNTAMSKATATVAGFGPICRGADRCILVRTILRGALFQRVQVIARERSSMTPEQSY